MTTWHFTRSNTSMRLPTAFAAEQGLTAERALVDNIIEHLAT